MECSSPRFQYEYAYGGIGPRMFTHKTIASEINLAVRARSFRYVFSCEQSSQHGTLAKKAMVVKEKFSLRFATKIFLSFYLIAARIICQLDKVAQRRKKMEVEKKK